MFVVAVVIDLFSLNRFKFSFTRQFLKILGIPIPKDIRESKSLSSFRQKIAAHIFEY